MMDNFTTTPALNPTPGIESIFPSYLEPISMKHRHPKGKKKKKKALKKAEHERDQLLVAYGRVLVENEFLKRSIDLAIAVSRKRYDDGLGDDTLRLLPPRKRK